MSDRVRQKRAAKRQLILDTALRLFAGRGYDATRMADIADELGLQKAALYYYFDSKEAVLIELIRSRIDAALQILHEIATRRGPVPERVAAAIRAHLRTFHADPDLYTVFNSERLRSISPDAAAIVDALGRRYERLWAKMLAEGMSQGSFRPDLDPPVAVKAVLGMLNTTLSWFEPGGRLSVDDLAELYVDLVLASIGDRSTLSDSAPPEAVHDQLA